MFPATLKQMQRLYLKLALQLQRIVLRSEKITGMYFVSEKCSENEGLDVVIYRQKKNEQRGHNSIALQKER